MHIRIFTSGTIPYMFQVFACYEHQVALANNLIRITNNTTHPTPVFHKIQFIIGMTMYRIRQQLIPTLRDIKTVLV